MRRHRQAVREEGSVAIYAVVVISGLLLMLALVVDGGGKLNAQERADSAAQEAARAGAEQINAGQAIAGNEIVVSPGQAEAAAYAYLREAGFGSGTNVYPIDGGRELYVSIRTTYTSVFGIGSLTVHGSATAALVYGVTTPKGP